MAIHVLHAMSCGTVSVVLPPFQVVGAVVLEPLLEREGVEFTTESELAVDFFLGDVEILYIEEA